MYYDDNVGFQKHSETSEAASKKVNRTKQCEQIETMFMQAGSGGLIGDDIARITGMLNGTVSARLIELESMGVIVRTEQKRKTRRGCDATICVAAECWVPAHGKLPTRRNKKASHDLLKRVLEHIPDDVLVELPEDLKRDAYGACYENI